jgi:uncharacterized membrane protein
MTAETFESQLAGEVAAWRRDGVIDARTAARILRRYGHAAPELEREVQAASRGRSSTIFGTAGALLVGLGVILFVASNWQTMERAARIGVLVGALALSAGLSFALRRSGHPRIGAALVFVNTLVFGANVFLIGQTYHVRVGDPLLFLLWSAGAVAMALASGSRPSLFLGLASLLAWYGTLIADWGAWIGPHPLVAPAFVGIGILYLGCARLAESTAYGRPLALVTALTGLAVSFMTIGALTFESVWRTVGESFFSRPAPVAPEFAWSVATILVSSTVVLVVRTWRARWSRAAMLESGGLFALAAVTLLCVVLAPFDSAAAYAVLFNVIALATVAWAIQMGLTTGRESFINAGLATFALLVIARYFDFFGTLFDRSLAFVGAGILLLAGGYALERSRTILLARVRGGRSLAS